ncbi:hypothetical protein ACMV8I_18845 [Ewingella sp. S1.OA.A_B6]
MARKQWSRSELDFLVEVASTQSAGELSQAMGRTPESVRTKARYFGIQLVLVRSNKDWTPAETALFTTHSDKEITLMTGRSLKSISAKRRRMNIYRRAA